MTFEEDLKRDTELFKKFCKMSPEELDAYEQQLADEHQKAEDEKEKYRRCSLEYCDYSKVVALARKGRDKLFGKWCATQSGIGHHPTVFRLLNMKVGTTDGEEYDILNDDGQKVLTPEQWFNSDKVWVYMFRFAPEYETSPDVYVKTSFGAGDLCSLESFLDELIREGCTKTDWWKMSVEEFKLMLKEKRKEYIDRVSGNLMGDNIEVVKKLYNILGI